MRVDARLRYLMTVIPARRAVQEQARSTGLTSARVFMEIRPLKGRQETIGTALSRFSYPSPGRGKNGR